MMSEKSKVINIRISEELYKSIALTVEDIKKNTPKGATVNRNSVVTTAIEEFISTREKEKQGIKSYDVNLEKLKDVNLEDLKKLDKALDVMENFNDLLTDEMHPAIYDVYKTVDDLSKNIFNVYMQKAIMEAERR